MDLTSFINTASIEEELISEFADFKSNWRDRAYSIVVDDAGNQLSFSLPFKIRVDGSPEGSSEYYIRVTLSGSGLSNDLYDDTYTINHVKVTLVESEPIVIPDFDPDAVGDPIVGDPIVGDFAPDPVGDPIVGDPIVGDPIVGDPIVGDFAPDPVEVSYLGEDVNFDDIVLVVWEAEVSVSSFQGEMLVAEILDTSLDASELLGKFDVNLQEYKHTLTDNFDNKLEEFKQRLVDKFDEFVEDLKQKTRTVDKLNLAVNEIWDRITRNTDASSEFIDPAGTLIKRSYTLDSEQVDIYVEIHGEGMSLVDPVDQDFEINEITGNITFHDQSLGDNNVITFQLGVTQLVVDGWVEKIDLRYVDAQLDDLELWLDQQDGGFNWRNKWGIDDQIDQVLEESLVDLELWLDQLDSGVDDQIDQILEDSIDVASVFKLLGFDKNLGAGIDGLAVWGRNYLGNGRDWLQLTVFGENLALDTDIRDIGVVDDFELLLSIDGMIGHVGKGFGAPAYAGNFSDYSILPHPVNNHLVRIVDLFNQLNYEELDNAAYLQFADKLVPTSPSGVVYHWKTKEPLSDVGLWVKDHLKFKTPFQGIFDFTDDITFNPAAGKVQLTMLIKSDVENFDFTISADNAISISFDKADELTDWFIETNNNQSDRLFVSGVSLNGIKAGTVIGSVELDLPESYVNSYLSFSEISDGLSITSSDDWNSSNSIGLTSAFTNTEGGYTFPMVNWGINQLIADKAVSEGVDEITSEDALAALKMAIGLNPNELPGLEGVKGSQAPSPFQFIAADVDGDTKVTSSDALAILKMAVKNNDEFNPHWVFVDEELSDDITIDFDSLSLANSSSVIWDKTLLSSVPDNHELNLIGVLVGDVDGSWAEHI